MFKQETNEKVKIISCTTDELSSLNIEILVLFGRGSPTLTYHHAFQTFMLSYNEMKKQEVL